MNKTLFDLFSPVSLAIPMETFTYIRTRVVNNHATIIPVSKETKTGYGSIQPYNDMTLSMGDHFSDTSEKIVIYTHENLTVGGETIEWDSLSADLVLFQEKRFKVVQKLDWSRFGYFRYIAVSTNFQGDVFIEDQEDAPE